MFEHKDNFLLTKAADVGEAAAEYQNCFIKNEAAESYDELAKLVGEGSKLEAAGDFPEVDEAQLPEWTEVTEAEAPRLEFNLEDELNRAFDGRQQTNSASAPYPDFGIRALQDAVAGAGREQMMPPIAESAETSESLAEQVVADPETKVALVSEPQTLELPSEPPSNGALSGMVSQEIERALGDFNRDAGILQDDHIAAVAGSEDIAMDMDIAAAEPEVPSTEAETPQDSLEDFSLELARLMGEPDTDPVTVEPVETAEAQPAQPAPAEAVMPWEAPEIVQHETPHPVEDEADAFGQEAPVYADSVPQMPPATSLELPSDSGANSSVDDVLARAGAVETAAARDANFEQNLETALSRELDAKMDVSDDQDADNGPAVIPPIYVQSAENAAKRQTGRRVAAGIVAVALLGGSATLAWNFVSSDESEPPTILASSEPVKVKPEDAGGEVVPNQDQSVYRAVDGEDVQQPQQEILKDDSETPIAVATAPSAETAAQPDAETELGSTAADPQTTGGPIVAPRRVRTVVVRPDGTIMTQAPANTPAPEEASELVAATSSEAPDPVAVKTVTTSADGTQAAEARKLEPTVEPDEAETGTLQTEPDTAALDGTEAAQSPVPEALQETVPQPAQPEPAETAAPADPAAAEEGSEAETPAVPAQPEPAPEPAEVAKVEPQPATPEPVETAAANAGTDPLAPATTSSLYSVQVSSQLSPEAAQQSYQSLSRHYASIIGGKGVNIIKSKVNGRDYYRVRIPAESKQAAQKMCGLLKVNGADCFVTR